MTVLAPAFGDTELHPVGDWHPSRYTATLSGTEDFTTEGDRLLKFAAKYWTVAEATEFKNDPWQRWVIRHALETYPPDWHVVHLRGQLRHKQLVISLARQNGKSLIGALLAFYFLTLHVRGPRVGGFASIESQAKIVYDRVKYAVDNSAELTAEIKATATRGITLRNRPGLYKTMPAKEDSVQGEPFSAALYDELHLGVQELWDAIVVGQRARPNSLLVGITTAGDADSDLLINLYEMGEAAIAGKDERFGFFVWEGADDELTEENVIRANPAVACGRIPLEDVMAEARRMWGKPKSRQKVIRFTLNRFLEGSAGAWISAHQFNQLAGDGIPESATGRPVFGIEKQGDWDYATITATVRQDGHLFNEAVATIVEPTPAQLFEACKVLARSGACIFAMPADSLKALGKQLRDEGFTVWMLGVTEMQAATAATKAAVKRRGLTHAGDPLIKLQSARAKPRVTGDGERISRTLSTGGTDGLLSLICGVYVAENQPEVTFDLG